MEKITTHQAKSQLSQLINRARSGEDIVIFRGDRPMVRLVPVRDLAEGRPKVGTITSRPVTYEEDAFAPLSDEELKDWGL